jgi:hypothetical protein
LFMSDGEYSFLAGMLLTILFALGIIVLTDLRSPNLIVEDKYLDYNNIRYNVTIDTVKTDSLFGKTWRK